MTVVCYTDASHCPQKKVAACGYVILVDGKMIKHQVAIVADCKSGDGEFYAAILALQQAYLQKDVTHIRLYTDCRSILIFKNGFRAQSKPFSKEYAETLAMLSEEGIKLKISFVKAHNGDHYNTKIDESCRKTLREFFAKNETA